MPGWPSVLVMLVEQNTLIFGCEVTAWMRRGQSVRLRFGIGRVPGDILLDLGGESAQLRLLLNQDDVRARGGGGERSADARNATAYNENGLRDRFRG